MLKFIIRTLSSKQQSLEMASTLRYFPNTERECDGNSLLQDFILNLPGLLPSITTHLTCLLNDIEKNIKPTPENAHDGVYLGTAGLSYMCYHLSKIPQLGEQKTDLLAKGLEYIKPALDVCKRSKRKDVPSFILGNCRVWAVACVIFKATGDDMKSEYCRKLFRDASKICSDLNFLGCGSDEYFVGRAGYILGAIWLAKETSTPLDTSAIHNLCNLMIESGRTYSKRNHSPCPLMYAYYKSEYLGAAHGLATILLALLTAPGYLDAHPNQAKDVKTTIDYLLSIQDKDGNFVGTLDELGALRCERHVQWCHGAPGMIYLMAKAHLIWREEKYLRACQKMADLTWVKGLLRKGPGLCHGVSGNGYVFLLLYRLTNENRYMYRAIVFARFLQSDVFLHGARVPDHPFSLYEGTGGAACFLADLLNPKGAVFPFLDVFCCNYPSCGASK